MFLKLTIFTVCACIAFDEVHLKELNQRASEEFANDVLVAHNNYRALHGVPPLVLNETISAVSQSYAEYLSTSTQTELVHSNNPNYGENLYKKWSIPPSESFDIPSNRAVDKWYGEIAKYTFGQEPTYNAGTGHFTQLVWRNSRQIGVGKERRNGSVWVVVNYYPPGNVEGRYAENVPPPTNEF